MDFAFPLSPATVNQHKQTLKDDISEYMLNNLRLVKAGVSEADFRSRFGSELSDVYGTEIEELIQFGLLERVGKSIRLTSWVGCWVIKSLYVLWVISLRKSYKV